MSEYLNSDLFRLAIDQPCDRIRLMSNLDWNRSFFIDTHIEMSHQK